MGGGGENLCDFFEESEFGETHLRGAASPEDIFSILESLEGVEEVGLGSKECCEETTLKRLVSQKSTSSETEVEAASSPKRKRQKLTAAEGVNNRQGGDQQRAFMSHITVERNRRKQMNENLSVLRSLMPSFYVKRGDQASIIGGVVDYINELQQVLQSLEAKKQRKVYSEVVQISPRLVSTSPRLPSPLSPRIPALSPRLISLPISPRTPQQPSSPYKPKLHHQHGYHLSTTIPTSILEPISSPASSYSSSNSSIDNNNIVNELVANSKSEVAEVEVKFSGPNVRLKTVSRRIPGQVMKIISTIQDLSLEILHVSINTIDETMINSFTIKIAIGCQLSVDELAQQIQQTFF